jgi:hypothetical protein
VIEALRQWRFEPVERRAGKPVSFVGQVAVRFSTDGVHVLEK